MENSYRDIFTIIFEEELEKYMNKNQNNDKWATVEYSKKQIDKAGKIIANKEAPESEKQWALDILNNWRAAHAYPLQVIASNLRNKNRNALVVQRLKRLDSITKKLERFENMSLYRMQDLGGCRVIVDSVDQVYEAVNQYKNSRIRHKKKREDDYIATPQKSGYRSYHLVYQFQSDKKETYNKNMLIEIQFRTQLQHMWATAVEMMGIYTKSALKASVGDRQILNFFALVSSVLAIIEKTNLVPEQPHLVLDLLDGIKLIDKKHNIISRLSALNVAIDYVSDNKKAGYYILILNYKNNRLKINHYKTSQIELATEVYSRIEQTNKKKEHIDSVLVSASSFDSLKAAYPNYFTDISGFVELMRRILSEDFLEELKS